MTLTLAILAACAYAVGGVFMKQSAGLSRIAPALMVFACFLIGSAIQSVSMRDTDMSGNYIVVLGFEAAVSLALGLALFGESMSAAKGAGVLLVVVGAALLRR